MVIGREARPGSRHVCFQFACRRRAESKLCSSGNSPVQIPDHHTAFDTSTSCCKMRYEQRLSCHIRQSLHVMSAAPLCRRGALHPAAQTSWALPGDHLWKKGGRFSGKLYDHHVIYKARDVDGHVIIENSFRAGGVVQKTLSDTQLRHYELYERPCDAESCLSRAEAAVTEGRKYSLVFYNCETFANDCLHGHGGSHQVRRATTHVALLTSVSGAAATSAAVGLVTTKHIVVTVPEKGMYGLWAYLGFTQPAVKTIIVSHPLGIATASGAACGCCIWACFAVFVRDPRKRRRRR